MGRELCPLLRLGCSGAVQQLGASGAAAGEGAVLLDRAGCAAPRATLCCSYSVKASEIGVFGGGELEHLRRWLGA